jgi:hypothetical protein
MSGSILGALSNNRQSWGKNANECLKVWLTEGNALFNDPETEPEKDESNEGGVERESVHHLSNESQFSVNGIKPAIERQGHSSELRDKTQSFTHTLSLILSLGLRIRKWSSLRVCPFCKDFEPRFENFSCAIKFWVEVKACERLCCSPIVFDC